MYGIGVDMVSVDRIEKSLERESFVKRIYGPGETALFIGENKIKTTPLRQTLQQKRLFPRRWAQVCADLILTKCRFCETNLVLLILNSAAVQSRLWKAKIWNARYRYHTKRTRQ